MGFFGEKRTPESPSSELDQPFENVHITDVKQPFPEAVIAAPVLAGRRVSSVASVDERRRSVVGTFDNDSLQSFYQPIDKYEGKHRYDPTFEWEKKEEKRLVRKVFEDISIKSVITP